MSDETKRTLIMAGIAFALLVVLLALEDYSQKRVFWEELNDWRVSQDRFADFLDKWERGIGREPPDNGGD